ncbi:metallophosphoesterase family protein [Nocardioides pakistanensis]
MSRPRLRLLGALAATWAVVALPVAALTFVGSSEATAVAGHDAVVTPTFDGYATLDLGPYLPNLRYPTERWLGAHIDFGKTTLTSYDELIDRYTVIGAQPEGEVAKVVGAMTGMALDAAVSGALAGLAGPALWLLLGSRRRAELFQHVTLRRTAFSALGLAVIAAAVLQPWGWGGTTTEQASEWQPIGDELSGVPIPEQAQPLEVEAGLFTTGTKRIAESLLASYSKGFEFYTRVADAVPDIADQIRQPEEDETVALLVSDRHDNVGMDKVARAIADAGGASVLLDAGDDTSTGSEWEAFSLDSLARVFEDYDRFAVTGNHDYGEFVAEYLGKLGFERFGGEAVDAPGDVRLLGADDPRSSGLGSWRDEKGLSFSEHAEAVADQLCEYDEQGDRVATLLTHDANTGRYALERGCVDLVVAGHVHEQLGPTEYIGVNGKVGYSYTNGTTGGAAYAIAVGSKLRRNAQITLVTYRDGRPVGLQPVTIRTVGDFRVGAYIELDPPVGDTEIGEPAESEQSVEDEQSGEE